MNKEQLLEWINSKIAGQGSAVDIGGALAPVLTELVTGLANMLPLTVEDIATLTGDQLEELSAGDKVIEAGERFVRAYVVNLKAEEGLLLTYADCDTVETVTYNKTGSGWEYGGRKETTIGQ